METFKRDILLGQHPRRLNFWVAERHPQHQSMETHYMDLCIGYPMPRSMSITGEMERPQRLRKEVTLSFAVLSVARLGDHPARRSEHKWDHTPPSLDSLRAKLLLVPSLGTISRHAKVHSY